ncbi:acetate/propionate family kinase [Loktanella sp. DJP18]|uniref:acetate/propionate family kinase n=1 Tax=Loktanella sp. DJP18 TaxID=3409788 RepID=UPI003BB7F63E
MSILVLNAGSSSVKSALFDSDLAPIDSLTLSEVADHQDAVATILDHYAAHRLTAAAHRVVHGGVALTIPTRITPKVRAQIAALIPLAPLHNPAALAGIDAVTALAPDLPQVACFDTGFHATNPRVATAYAIPDTPGIRRYGFHGISYADLVGRLDPQPHRLLALHLGNGASLCAIRSGHSVATTMGYSPLDGLTMGTRSGTIDPAAVLALARLHGIDGAETLLNRKSGLLALGGASDMRTLSRAQTKDARFAIGHFTYWAVRHAGSMIAAMGGIDALAFTGGIGENDPNIRAAIMEGLAFTGLVTDADANVRGDARLHTDTSPVSAWIVPAQEERAIAAAALRLIA